MHKWSDAIRELRTASLGLSSWAARDPGWEMRLFLAMSGGRQWRREQKWRERKQKVARALQAIIADEIRVLQGLGDLTERSVER
jgi:hypothetical protein